MNTVKLPRIVNKNGGYDDVVPALSASIHLKVAPLSTASITLQAGRTLDVRTYVEMFTENGSAGVFRVRAPKEGLGSQLSTVELEHAVAEVGDYIFAETYEAKVTLSAAMQKLFSHYKGTKWKLGTIDNSNTMVVLSADYDSILDATTELLKQVPSLMIAFDFRSYPWGFLIKQKPTNITAEGRLRRNITSATVTFDDTEMCNRVYLKNLGGTASAYGSMEDYAAIRKFGLIEKQISGANSTQAIAQTTASTYLNSHKNPRISVDIDLIDLSKLTGASLDEITLAKKFGLYVPEYQLFVEETITELNYSDVYGDPKAVSAHLAEDDDAVVVSITSAGKSAKKAAKNAEKANEKVDNEKTRIDLLIEGNGGSAKIRGNAIVGAINSNGKEPTKINFPKLNVTVANINGLYDKATFKAQNATIANTLTAKDATISNDATVPDSSTGKAKSVRDALYDIQLSGYKLQGMRYSNSKWVDLVNFKNVVSLSGAWSNGNLTVTAKMNNLELSEKFKRTLNYTLPGWSNHKMTIPIKAEWYVGGNTYTEDTGKNVFVDATSEYDDGWGAARASVFSQKYTVNDVEYSYFPTTQVGNANRLQYIKVAQPNATVDGSLVSLSYYVTSDNNVAYIRYNNTSGSIVAKVEHNKYNSGWQAANSAVIVPTSTNTGRSAITITVPAYNVGGTDQYLYELQNHNKNAVNLITTVGDDDIVVARFTHNKWNAGWDDACDEVAWPTAIVTPGDDEYPTFSMSAPVSYENQSENTVREQSTQTFEMGTGSPAASGFATVKRGQALIARIQIGNWYTTGRTDGWRTAQTGSSTPITQAIARSAYTVTIPAYAYNNFDTYTYEMKNSGNNAVDVFTTIGDDEITIARYNHNKWNKGWDDAAREVVWPTAIITPGALEYLTFSVSAPVSYENTQTHAQVRESSTQTFTLATGNPAASGYATVKRGEALIARISIGNWYTSGRWDGWHAAQQGTSIPLTSATNRSAFTVTIPDYAYNDFETHVYELQSYGNNAVDLITTIGDDEVTVARLTHNKWNAGWIAAAGEVDIQSELDDSSTTKKKRARVTFPVDIAGNSGTAYYYPDADNSNAYIRYNASNGAIVAQVTNPAWGNAYSKVSIQDELDTTSAATKKRVKVNFPEEIPGQAGSVYYHLDVADDYCYIRYNASNGAIVAQVANPHTITDFDVYADEGASKIIGNTTYTNNADGYYISGSGYSPTIFTIITGKWKENGNNRQGNVNSYLAETPRKIYQKGWTNARAAETLYSLKCTSASQFGGGLYKYIFEYTGTSGLFTVDTNYSFYMR